MGCTSKIIQVYIIDNSEQKHHFKPVPFRRDLLIQLPHEFLTTRNDRENCGRLSHMALSETCGNHNVLWLIFCFPHWKVTSLKYISISPFQTHPCHIVGWCWLCPISLILPWFWILCLLQEYPAQVPDSPIRYLHKKRPANSPCTSLDPCRNTVASSWRTCLLGGKGLNPWIKTHQHAASAYVCCGKFSSYTSGAKHQALKSGISGSFFNLVHLVRNLSGTTHVSGAGLPVPNIVKHRTLLDIVNQAGSSATRSFRFRSMVNYVHCLSFHVPSQRAQCSSLCLTPAQKNTTDQTS